MQDTPSGWVRDVTASGSVGVPRQRWAWTHRYAVPLLVASIASVLLSGSGLLVAVNVLGGEGGGGDPVEPSTTPTIAPATLTGPECVVGSWHAVELEEDINTGILVAQEEVAFEYGADGTAAIDYGESTSFLFEDEVFGELSEPSESVLSGRVTYQYEADDTRIRYSGINSQAMIDIVDFPGGGLELPYYPGAEDFGYECTGDSMTHQADDIGYRAEFRRVSA